MRIALALLLALLCSARMEASPRHWYSDGKFWIGEAVIVASTFADARTTCKGFSRGLVEGNPLAQNSNSCGSAIAILSIGTVIYSGLHVASYRILQDDNSKRWRALSLITVPAIACAFHCAAAVHNAQITPAR